MDKEKAEGLVKSLIIYAQDASYYTERQEVGSPHYREALRRLNELRNEIITYLVDGGENEQEIKYPLGLCIDLLHFSILGSKKTTDKTAYDIKQMLLNFFTQEEIDEALKILGIGGFGRR